MSDHKQIPVALAQIGNYVVCEDGTVNIIDTPFALELLVQVAAQSHRLFVPFPRVFSTPQEAYAYLGRN